MIQGLKDSKFQEKMGTISMKKTNLGPQTMILGKKNTMFANQDSKTWE